MTQNNERTQRFTIIANNSILTEDRYSSVEFCIKDLEFNYQFKIWETKTPELNILIKRNAIIMKHLHVGNTVDIKCIPSGGSRYPVTMRTKIKMGDKSQLDNLSKLYMLECQPLESKKKK